MPNPRLVTVWVLISLINPHKPETGRRDTGIQSNSFLVGVWEKLCIPWWKAGSKKDESLHPGCPVELQPQRIFSCLEGWLSGGHCAVPWRLWCGRGWCKGGLQVSMETERGRGTILPEGRVIFYKEINSRFNTSGLGFQSEGASSYVRLGNSLRGGECWLWRDSKSDKKETQKRHGWGQSSRDPPP